MTEQKGSATAPDPTHESGAGAHTELAHLHLPWSEAGTSGEHAEDEQTVLRIEQLPRDVGWLLVYVGVLGVLLPGVIGFPFLIAGGAVLAPGGPQLLSRWVGRKPSGFVHTSMKQITRLLDDVERRYPRLPGPSS